MKVKFRQMTAVSFSLRLILLSLFALSPLLATPTPRLHTYLTVSRQEQQQSRTIVRGKLVRKMSVWKKLTIPASYVAVTLSVPKTGERSVPVYTDANGMYYIDIPPGDYILEIWGSEKKVIGSYKIHVPAKQYFDVAPITIP